MVNYNKLDTLLSGSFKEAIEEKIFSGAALGFIFFNEGKFHRFERYYGSCSYEKSSTVVNSRTLFDLASLTKPLATLPALLHLMASHSLKWETSLADVFGSSLPPEKTKITFQQLVTHSAGFPSHRNYYIDLIKQPEQMRKKQLLQAILEESLEYQPGKQQLYSDLDFMLLGFLIEKKSAVDLKSYVEDRLYKPLGLKNDLFFPSPSSHHSAVETEKCPWSGKMLSGQVHDDNCRAMGSVAGHAGLFGTLIGVLRAGEWLLTQYLNKNKSGLCQGVDLRQELVKDGKNRCWPLGFDRPAETGSSSGRYLSSSAFGHLGFTGTSLWIDPEQQLVIVLLSNRVHPSRENTKIRQFRPLIHDCVLEWLRSQTTPTKK